MTRNLPTLAAIAADGNALKGLSLDALDALLSEAEAENKTISAAKRAIVGYLEASYAGDISAAYDVKGADFGSIRVSDGGYELHIDTPKRVEWDQAQLRTLREKIAENGDNPDEYVKATFGVDERAYAAWPSYLRLTFEPARTVKPGSRTVKLVRKEAA